MHVLIVYYSVYCGFYSQTEGTHLILLTDKSNIIYFTHRQKEHILFYSQTEGTNLILLTDRISKINFTHRRKELNLFYSQTEGT